MDSNREGIHYDAKQINYKEQKLLYSMTSVYTEELKLTPAELIHSLGFNSNDYRYAYERIFHNTNKTALLDKLKYDLKFDASQIDLKDKSDIVHRNEIFDLYCLLKLLYKYEKDGKQIQDKPTYVKRNAAYSNNNYITHILSIIANPSHENISLLYHYYCYKNNITEEDSKPVGFVKSQDESGNKTESGDSKNNENMSENTRIKAVYGKIYDDFVSEIEQGIKTRNKENGEEFIRLFRVKYLDAYYAWRSICDQIIPTFADERPWELRRINECKEFLEKYYNKYINHVNSESQEFPDGVLMAFYTMLLNHECLCRDAYLEQTFKESDKRDTIIKGDYIKNYNRMYCRYECFDGNVFKYIEDSIDTFYPDKELPDIWELITYNLGVKKIAKGTLKKAVFRAQHIIEWIYEELDSLLTEEERNEPNIKRTNEWLSDKFRLRQVVAAIQEQLYGYTGKADIDYYAIKSEDKRKTYSAGLKGGVNQTLARYWATKINDREAMNSGMYECIKPKYEVMNILFKFSQKIFSFYSVDDMMLVLSLIVNDFNDCLLHPVNKQDCKNAFMRQARKENLCIEHFVCNPNSNQLRLFHHVVGLRDFPSLFEKDELKYGDWLRKDGIFELTAKRDLQDGVPIMIEEYHLCFRYIWICITAVTLKSLRLPKGCPR